MKLNSQQVTADIAAIGSSGAVGYTWLAQLNGILPAVALIVAIVSGIYAIRYHANRKK